MRYFLKKYSAFFAAGFFVLALENGYAQSVQQYISIAQSVQQKAPREILYLHFDKPSYIIGDTIWFAAYLLDAHDYTPSQLSGVAYVELISPDNSLIKRFAIHLALGHGFAQIPIDKKLLPGNYHIRAYTRWMENFPDSLFFRKEVPIVGGAQNWLMNVETFHQFQNTNADSISMKFYLKDQNGNIAKHTSVTLNVTNNKGKTLLSKSLMTRADGSLDINFSIDGNKRNNNVSLNILDEAKISRITYPINFGETKNKTDVQFLPEGGHIITGIKNEIAFKAINKNGTGTDVQGIVKNSKGDSVVAFLSLYKGMGTFYFVPQQGENYYAELNNRDTIHLPVIENSGTLVYVDALSNADSIIVSVHATNDLAGQRYLFFGKYKGYILYGATLIMKNSVMRIAISKNIFPTGINSVYLLKPNGQLLNERTFFVNHHDNLKVAIQEPEDAVLTRDSVLVKIKVTNQNNNPVQGVFSLAVTDNLLVRKDATNDENILSYFLLSSDLKGKIETPGYYFSDTNFVRQKELDNLLLTQGFVKYDWDTTKMTIPAEPEFEVGGKATSLFGKPLKKANITLLGNGKQPIVMDTVTDDEGRFLFNHFPLFDTLGFFVQARNKKNKSFGVGIELKEYDFPVVKNNYENSYLFPANVNIDTTLQNQLVQYGKYNIKKYGKGELPDVVVTTKERIDGSENLNGPGQYDKAITLGELQNMGDSTLLRILQSKLKGFNVGTCGRDPSLRYMLNGSKVRFVFDGVQLDFFYHAESEPGTMNPYYQFVTDYLKYYTAKDIKGIEVMESSKFTDKYVTTDLTPEELMNYNPVLGCPYSFIEITTYSKAGPFVKHNATVDIYRPQPFSYGKEFYQPKYINRQLQDSLPDTRSTIYWNPLIVTDKNGEAAFHFYSASSATNYLFWLEGTDANGHLGFTTKDIEVKEE